MPDKKLYKPIVVIYLHELDISEIDRFKTHLKPTFKKAGYENIIILMSDDFEERVEIISVDKATVVEDIKKYINTKLFNGPIEIPHVPKEQRATKPN